MSKLLKSLEFPKMFVFAILGMIAGIYFVGQFATGAPIDSYLLPMGIALIVFPLALTYVGNGILRSSRDIGVSLMLWVVAALGAMFGGIALFGQSFDAPQVFAVLTFVVSLMLAMSCFYSRKRQIA